MIRLNNLHNLFTYAQNTVVSATVLSTKLPSGLCFI